MTAGTAVQLVDPRTELASSHASARLRVHIPARQLAASVPVALVPLEALVAGHGLDGLGRPRAVVVAKRTTADVVVHQGLMRSLFARLAQLDLPLFADFSDDYAAMARETGQPFLEEYQRELAERCAVIVPCEALAERLRPIARRGVHVIEDPWESPRAHAPHAPGGAPVRLCWFGYLPGNIVGAVERSLERIARTLAGRPAVCEFVTKLEGRDVAARIAARLRTIHPGFELRFVEWSPAATWQAIGASDLVVLPHDAGSDWASVKSHNRLVEAIRGGRLAVAAPIPSYLELAEFAWLGGDLGEGVAWALAHPAEARERVARGQVAIGARFAPEAIGGKWARALGVAG